MTAAFVLISLGLPIGFLIGLIGIGGVLLTPALVHLFGRDIHESVSLSLASFVLAGVLPQCASQRMTRVCVQATGFFSPRSSLRLWLGCSWRL